MRSSHYRYLGLFVFALLCYFPLFLHLDSLPLRLWDEARRGVNTIELLDNGHWFIPHFDGHPDLWGTKPPLLIWLQAFFSRLLGLSELSIRLPSALAGLATVAMLIVFAKRLGRPLAGYFGALVLLTTNIYIDHHGAISGDYDALLTLWETAYLFCGYLLIARREWKWLNLMALFIFLAGWTKGVAGLFFLPGLGAYYLWHKRGRAILGSGRFWLTAGITLTGILSYYLIREMMNPGFLAQVWDNELMGRYSREMGNYGRHFLYYFTFIYREDGFFPWLYFLPLAFLLGWKSLRTRHFTLLVGINTLLFYLLISGAATRLSWYCLPSFPALALLVGVGLERMYAGIIALPGLRFGQRSRPVLAGLFCLTFFAYPYWQTVQRVYRAGLQPTEYYSEMYRGFIRNLPPEERSFTILYDQYSAHPVFYRMFYNRKGYSIKSLMLRPPRPAVNIHQVDQGEVDFQPGEKVMVCEKPAKDHLEKHYEFEAQHYFHNCQLVLIKRKLETGQKTGTMPSGSLLPPKL